MADMLTCQNAHMRSSSLTKEVPMDPPTRFVTALAAGGHERRL